MQYQSGGSMMRGYSAGRALAMGCLVVLTAGGCGGDDNSPNPTVVLAKAPSKNGDAQTGPAGEALLSPLRVSVTSDGIPQSGATVTWSTTDGSVDPTSMVTGADGVGATTWTLGPDAGAQTAQAAVSGASGSPVTFSATATGDGGPPPSIDPDAIAVTVANNSFTSDRNGTVNPAVDTLALNGTVTWTWGPGAGTHTVRSNQTLGAPTFPESEPKTGSGQTYSAVFTEAGTYTYDCAIHPGIMTGRIVVR
jgi:plastocyanin